MAEPFDVTTDETQGTTFAPTFTEPAPQPVSPEALGFTPGNTAPVMGPPPMPPAPVVVPPPPPITADPKNQIAALAALGMAIGAGRGGGAGALHGFLQSQQAQEQARQEQYQYQQQLAQRQNAINASKFKQDATQYEADEKRLQSMLLSMQRQIAQAKTPAQYDALIGGFTQMLHASGYPRITEAWLRNAAKFVPPDEKTTIADQLDAFFKNPENANLLKDPEQLNQTAFTYTTADGTPRTLAWREAFIQAHRPFTADPTTGKVLMMGKGATLEDKANADSVFQTLLADAKNQGLDTTDPKLRLKLQQQAIDTAKDRDPLGERVKQLQIQKLQQEIANGTVPTDPASVSDMAKAIAEYRMAPISPRSAQTPAGSALMAQVLKANPAYDATQFAARNKMRTAFTSGTQAQQLTALNTAIEHLGVLNDFAKALDNGTFTPGNELYNRVRTMFGSQAVTNFSFARDIMAGELATAMKKSGATDVEIDRVTNSLSSAASPKQLGDAIRSVAVPMISGKARVMDEQYHAAMGAADPFSVYTPGAQNVLSTIGSSGPTSAPDLTGLGRGQKRTFRSGPWAGQSWTIGADGKPVQVR